MEVVRPLIDVIIWVAPAFLVAAAVVIDLWASIKTRRQPSTRYKPAIHAAYAWLAAAVVIVLAVVFRRSYWPQFALLIALLAVVLWFNRKFLWGMSRYLLENVTQTFLLAVFYLMTWGWLLSWFGIPDLIWHESLSLRFASAVASTMVLALFGVCAFYVGGSARQTDIDLRQLNIDLRQIKIEKIKEHYDENRAHRELADWLAPRDEDGVVEPLHQFLWVVQLPFLLLLLLPALFPRVFPYVPRLEWPSELRSHLANLFIWSYGVAAGVIFVKLALYIGNRFAPYSDPFAIALGEAGQRALDAVASISGWLKRLFSKIWEMLAALWNKLEDPAELESWVFNLIKKAGSNVCASFIKVWNRLQGNDVPTQVPARRQPMAGPVKGPEDEMRGGLFSFVLLVASFFVALNLIDAFSLWAVPPGVALFALLALLVMLDALSRILLPADRWYWRFPVLMLLLLWIAWANHDIDKLQFENMSYDPTAKVVVRDRVAAAYFASSGAAEEKADGLVDDALARSAWLAHVKGALGDVKPKLVVVSCSGGGARSLAWTSLVLDRLGKEIKGFDLSVRLISCASAGSAGAAYYVKSRYDQLANTHTPPQYRLKPHNWSAQVPRDCESAVVRSIALREVWRMFNPQPVGGAPPEDRGRMLEKSWVDLRQVPLQELRSAERTGLLPSLVMAPLSVEDGRRLLLSNLDLRGLVKSSGPELLVSGAVLKQLERPEYRGSRQEILALVDAIESGHQLYTAPGGAGGEPSWRGFDADVPDVARTNYSLSAVEFARVFDRAGGLRLATAARMSAALPMFTPAVYLPSDPPLRIIDSGYFDNYGIDVAAAWLFLNRDWIKQETSGVILVQVRAMGRREARTSMVTSQRGLATRLLGGYQVIESVAEGAVNALSAGAIFRNDREVAWLSELFNRRSGGRRPSDFFTTVVFENTAIVRTRDPNPASSAGRQMDPGGTYGALTWRLTEADYRSIQDAFQPPPRVAKGEVMGLELVEDRQRRLDNPNLALDDGERAHLTWELEQAQNHERLETMVSWWSAFHEPGDAEQKPLPRGRSKARRR